MPASSSLLSHRPTRQTISSLLQSSQDVEQLLPHHAHRVICNTISPPLQSSRDTDQFPPVPIIARLPCHHPSIAQQASKFFPCRCLPIAQQPQQVPSITCFFAFCFHKHLILIFIIALPQASLLLCRCAHLHPCAATCIFIVASSRSSSLLHCRAHLHFCAAALISIFTLLRSSSSLHHCTQLHHRAVERISSIVMPL